MQVFAAFQDRVALVHLGNDVIHDPVFVVVGAVVPVDPKPPLAIWDRHDERRQPLFLDPFVQDAGNDAVLIEHAFVIPSPVQEHDERQRGLTVPPWRRVHAVIHRAALGVTLNRGVVEAVGLCGARRGEHHNGQRE